MGCIFLLGFKGVWTTEVNLAHAVWCRVGGDIDPGRNERGASLARVNPQRKGLVRTQPATGGHQLQGADSRSASFPVYDVNQDRITEGVGGWGMTRWEDK